MGKTYDSIDEKLADFITRQQMFFVATAPARTDGLLNLSPKGLDSFRILDDRTVAYADIVGSGIETVAHLKENGRIIVMFCAFDGPPNIVRLYGGGEVVEPGHEDFEELKSLFPEYVGLRSVIRVRCERIADSCGYGVPLFDYRGQRTQLTRWAEQTGAEGIPVYQRENNAESIDGLPGLAFDD